MYAYIVLSYSLLWPYGKDKNFANSFNAVRESLEKS